MTLNSKRLIDLATKLQLPAMYQTGQFIEDGGLMGYGVNYADLPSRGDLCRQDDQRDQACRLTVELPMRFELLIICRRPSRLV